MSQSAAITSRNRMHAHGQRLSARTGWLALFVALVIGAFCAPPTSFIIDGGVYYDMAKAFAEEGALHIGHNGGIDGAPALTKYLTIARDGLVYPQYPSGYAFLAAPFYLAFGIHGLMLMNALCAGLSIYLTHRIAQQLYTENIAHWSAGIFAVATFAPSYMFAIWPHMLSLAFWLGAVYFAILASKAPSRRTAYLCLGAAGLLIGVGINIRIDVVLAALAIFFWLRCFVMPADRVAPICLVLGMAPGLLFSAYINALKFGNFTPFTYGSQSGADNLGAYNTALVAAAGVLLIVWILNVRAILQRAVKSHGAATLIALGGFVIVAILLIAPLRELTWRITEGAYVLVINLQAHNAYYQTGVDRNVFDQLLFWDYPKKALIQSLPYMPLMLLPLYHFLRGKAVAALSICMLAITAPIAFYSIHQWHGGGCYSMRYFLPAVPFIAILSAAAQHELMGHAARPSLRYFLIAITAASIIHLGMIEIGQSTERLRSPAALYPQWLIAALLSASIIAYIRHPSIRMRKYAIAVAVFAIAYAGVINLYEEVTTEKTRYEQMTMAREISAPIPEGSLVLTKLPLTLAPAERNGVHVMVADNNALDAMKAVRAFSAAGACVYFHNMPPHILLAPLFPESNDAKLVWAQSTRFDRDPRLAFYVLSGAPSGCAF